jgi:hypothetical protein
MIPALELDKSIWTGKSIVFKCFLNVSIKGTLLGTTVPAVKKTRV